MSGRQQPLNLIDGERRTLILSWHSGICLADDDASESTFFRAEDGMLSGRRRDSSSKDQQLVADMLRLKLDCHVDGF